MFQGIASLMVARLNEALATPYLQKTEFNSTVKGTSFTPIWAATPTNGNLLVLITLADQAPVATPTGWNLLDQTAAGAANLGYFYKSASGSEPTSVPLTISTAGIICVVMLEFPGSWTAIDDYTARLINQGNATNDIFDAVTLQPVELVIAAVSYYDLTHAEGPFTFDNSFKQIAYVQAPANSTSGVAIELVVGFLQTVTSGTYHTNITSTNIETGTFFRAIIVAHKP